MTVSARAVLIGGAKERKWKKTPFHVVHVLHNDVHVGYEIYVLNHKFLHAADNRYPLKRYEAYAIVKLLNKLHRRP